MSEGLFRALTGALLASMAVVRAPYVKNARGGVTAGRGDRAVVAGVGVSLCLLALYALGVRRPRRRTRAGPLRLTGVPIAALGLVLLRASHAALGTNWSLYSGTRRGSGLVTSGPYRWVRHPMYDAIFLTAAGALLLTADALSGGVYAFAVAVMYAARVRREESRLAAAFGREYERYVAVTPRLLPRPWRREVGYDETGRQ